MVHYRMREPEPSAIVLAQNPRTGSYEETKMYSGFNQKEVYLQDKQNFALRFFNPMQVKIGARISFNGLLSNDYLVLNPGEDVVLERFLGEQKKMVFDTYTIDASNPSAMKAIEKNGLIEISFYKERPRVNYNPPIYKSYGGDITYRGFGNQCSGGLGHSNLNINSTVTTDVFMCENDMSYTASASLTPPTVSASVNQPLETGRVEAGDFSNQQLSYTDVEFEIFPFTTYVIKLVPQSQERQYSTYTSTNTREVRNYCTGCGYRLRNDNWLYCPKCGTKL